MSKKKDISKKELKKRIKLEDKIFKLILKSSSKKQPLDEQIYSVIDFLEQLQFSLKEIVSEDEKQEAEETQKILEENNPQQETREEIKEPIKETELAVDTQPAEEKPAELAKAAKKPSKRKVQKKGRRK